MTNRPTIVLIDENEADRALAKIVLERSFELVSVREITDVTSLMDTMLQGEFHCLITEHLLSWLDGFSLCDIVKKHFPECTTIIFTSQRKGVVTARAEHHKVDMYMYKTSQGYLDLGQLVKEQTGKAPLPPAGIQPTFAPRDILATTPAAIYRMAPGGTLIYGNPAFSRLLGYPDWTHLKNRSVGDIFADKEEFASWMSEIEECKDNAERVIRVRLMDGKECMVCNCVRPVHKPGGDILFFDGYLEDLSGVKEGEKRLESALKEKELLLKEVHHRVKNNLQAISSLLNLQSSTIEDPAIRALFSKSLDRIHSMILIHDKLYHSKDPDTIEFSDYVHNLTSHLLSSYGITPDNITLTLNVNNTAFDIETATSCGLIINELVANSLKHAFSDGRKGEVSVACSRDDNGTYTLRVKDNGIGLPANINPKESESLGLQIVDMLAEQINGTVEVDRSQGTEFIITFAHH